MGGLLTHRIGTLASGLPAATNPSFANVELLLGLNGADAATSTTDESVDARAVTFVGNAQLDTADKKFGTASLLLDGSGDNLTVPHAAELQMSAQTAMTAECWFNPAVITGGVNHVLIDKRPTTSAHEYSVWINGTGKRVHFITWRNGSPEINITSADNSISVGTWFHMAAVRSGNNYYLFLDGALAASGTSANAPTASTATTNIGRTGFTSTPHWFNGWIDEVRITTEVFYPLGGFIPPTAEFPRS